MKLLVKAVSPSAGFRLTGRRAAAGGLLAVAVVALFSGCGSGADDIYAGRRLVGLWRNEADGTYIAFYADGNYKEYRYREQREGRWQMDPANRTLQMRPTIVTLPRGQLLDVRDVYSPTQFFLRRLTPRRLVLAEGKETREYRQVRLTRSTVDKVR
ncbi:MAG: hypothetical protein KY476_09825 [Planctomycetes bacterium]|nr:hypothetical protein [Planctomycetota bacterium]